MTSEELRAHRESSEKVEIDRIMALVRATSLKVAGIPEARADMLCKADEDELDRVIESGGAYYWGPSGRGKTWTAMGVVGAAIDRGMDAAIIGEVDLFEKAKAAMGGGHDGSLELIDFYATKAILCVDDLGKKANHSDWSLQLLLHLVDVRERYRLPTVYTSESTITDICARWADKGLGSLSNALWSRIGSLTVQLFSGPDRRAGR